MYYSIKCEMKGEQPGVKQDRLRRMKNKYESVAGLYAFYSAGFVLRTNTGRKSRDTCV